MTKTHKICKNVIVVDITHYVRKMMLNCIEDKDRITQKQWNVPDLVLEILSENSIEEDRKCKFKQYQKAGIQEYWIVDPFEQTIEIFTLENGSYNLFGKWGVGEMAHSKVITGLQVAVDSVFE